MKLSIIIPTKEEAANLPTVLEELRMVLGREIEIIVVDAGSLDGTADMARRLGCRTLRQKEPGYGAAVSEGLKAATGELVTFFDADGSYNPRFLLAALPLIEQGKADAVFCTRYHTEAGSDDDTLIRYAGNLFFSILLRAMFGVRLSDALHLYVLARRELAGKLPIRSRAFDYCVEFPLRWHKAGYSYLEIPMRERPRISGKSKVHALKDGARILWSMLKWRLGS